MITYYKANVVKNAFCNVRSMSRARYQWVRCQSSEMQRIYDYVVHIRSRPISQIVNNLQITVELVGRA